MPRARNQYIQEMKERFEPLDRKMMKSSAPAEETITLVDEQQNTATDLEAMVCVLLLLIPFIITTNVH